MWHRPFFPISPPRPLDPSPAELKMTPAFDLSSDPSRHKVTSRVQTYAATATWQLGKMTTGTEVACGVVVACHLYMYI